MAHSIPAECVSHVVRIVTAVLANSSRNLQQFQGINGMSILVSLFEVFDDACITHDLFLAVKDFCTQALASSTDELAHSLLFQWNVWRKGDAAFRQYVVDSLLKTLKPGEGWAFFRVLLNDPRCDALVLSTLVNKAILQILEKDPSQLDTLLVDLQQEDASGLFVERLVNVLSTAFSQGVLQTMQPASLVRLIVHSVLRHNESSVRVALYELCWSVLHRDASFAITEADIGLIVMAYRQLCAFELPSEEFQAILQLATEIPRSSQSKEVVEIRRPLFLQLAIRLLAKSNSIYSRELALQAILDAVSNAKKKENMKWAVWKEFHS